MALPLTRASGAQGRVPTNAATARSGIDAATRVRDDIPTPSEAMEGEAARWSPRAGADWVAGVTTTVVSEVPFATPADDEPLLAGGRCFRGTEPRTRQLVKRERRTFRSGLKRFCRSIRVGTEPSNNSSASAVSIAAANRIVRQKRRKHTALHPKADITAMGLLCIMQSVKPQA